MPKMNLSQEFERALAIARITMQFGQVRRVTMHENGEHESDTTHTVMLTLLGIEMAPLAGCDPGLVAQFAAVHDLPETYAGDTNTARGLSPVEIEEKAGREALAMERLRDDLGDSPVLALLERYEAQEEPEARLVRYLDKVTPKLTHRLNRGRALAAMDLTTSDVREKHAMQGEQLARQTASAWEEAAIREWAPLAPDYHDGDGTVAAAIEGPYIEHRLVMAWRGKVRRMADHLGADDSSSLPNYGEFGPNNTSEKLPRVIDTVTLSTIGALCRHFILITTADKQCPEGRAGRRLSVGLCRIVVEPTVNGPVINDVPDPNVAWSAYAYVHDVRVDLYGCGPTPTAALECLERDRQRKMERLKEVLRG